MYNKKVLLATLLASISLGAIAQESEAPMTAPKVAVTDKIKEVVPKVVDVAARKEKEREKEAAAAAALVAESAPVQVATTNHAVSSPEPKFEKLPAKESESGLDENTKKHNENIRNVINTFVEAVNTRNGEKLAEVSRESLVVVDSSQNFATKKGNIDEFFPKVVGKEYKLTKTGFLISPGFTVEIDSSGNWATVYGSGEEKYNLSDKEHKVQTRWSAVLTRTGSEWKVYSFQEGVDFTNNSFLKSIEEFGWKLGFVGGMVGLVLGFIIGLVVGKAASKKND